MASKTELERLAAEGAALRPDWPVRSVLTYLANNHAHRAYRDIAVALAYIATDPTTKTPRRLGEAGPWWMVSPETAASTVPRAGAIRCPLHAHEIAANCRSCRAEKIAIADGTSTPTERDPLVSAERVRQILDAAFADGAPAYSMPVDHKKLASGDAQ